MYSFSAICMFVFLQGKRINEEIFRHKISLQVYCTRVYMVTKFKMDVIIRFKTAMF